MKKKRYYLNLRTFNDNVIFPIVMTLLLLLMASQPTAWL